MKTEITWRTDEPPLDDRPLLILDRYGDFEVTWFSGNEEPSYLRHRINSVEAWAELPDPRQVRSGCSEESDVKEPSA